MNSVFCFPLFVFVLNSLTKEFLCGCMILFLYYWKKGQAGEADNSHVQEPRVTGTHGLKGLISVLFCFVLVDITIKQLNFGGNYINGTLY